MHDDKNRPTIQPICFGEVIENFRDTTNILSPNKIVNSVDNVIHDISKTMASEMVELDQIDVDTAMKSIKKDNDGIHGAKIQGTYFHYLELMIKKHQQKITIVLIKRSYFKI